MVDDAVVMPLLVAFAAYVGLVLAAGATLAALVRWLIGKT